MIEVLLCMCLLLIDLLAILNIHNQKPNRGKRISKDIVCFIGIYMILILLTIVIAMIEGYTPFLFILVGVILIAEGIMYGNEAFRTMTVTYFDFDDNSISNSDEFKENSLRYLTVSISSILTGFLISVILLLQLLVNLTI